MLQVIVFSESSHAQRVLAQVLKQFAVTVAAATACRSCELRTLPSEAQRLTKIRKIDPMPYGSDYGRLITIITIIIITISITSIMTSIVICIIINDRP